MSPFQILQDWKSKPYQRTNYENIHVFYGDQKYIRMKPKSQISLTSGFLHLILKHPKEYIRQNIKLEDEVTLRNDTINVLYYTLLNHYYLMMKKNVNYTLKMVYLRKMNRG